MAGSDNRFERVRLLSAAFDPIIDICVLLGVHTSELEAAVRVEFVKRAAATLPPSEKIGTPSHEQVGLAAGLDRREVQKIRSRGTSSTQLRMKKRSPAAKSDRVLDRWKSDPRFMNTSGGPLNLPVHRQDSGPSFDELVAGALPGKTRGNVLQDLVRRGLVQELPDHIVRIRKSARPLPTELNETSLSFVAEQMRIVGTALVQSILDPQRAAASLDMVLTSEMVSIPQENILAVRAALHDQIATFVQAFEKDFARKSKGRKKKTAEVLLGTTVFTFSNK